MSMFGEPQDESGEGLVFSFTGQVRSFLGLSLKNGLLNIVTLSLYRFWAKTETRRRIWSAIRINDEPLEYTGRGKELFFGFLFAMLLLGLPVLVIAVGVQFLGPLVAGLAFLLVYPFMIGLLGFARFSAFRYMASRTTWRGVRFQLRGSGLRYGLAFLGYALMSAITLGWYWPAAQRRLAGRLWGALSYGDRQMNFNLEKAQNVSIYAPFIPAAMGFAILYVVVMFAFGLTEVTDAKAPTPDLMVILKFYAVLPLLAVAWAVMFAPYHVAQLRSVAEGTHLDGLRFDLQLRWQDMASLWVGNVAMLILSLGLLAPMVQARTARVLTRSLKSRGSADLHTTQAPAGPRTGEGLADAFGVIDF